MHATTNTVPHESERCGGVACQVCIRNADIREKTQMIVECLYVVRCAGTAVLNEWVLSNTLMLARTFTVSTQGVRLHKQSTEGGTGELRVGLERCVCVCVCAYVCCGG